MDHLIIIYLLLCGCGCGCCCCGRTRTYGAPPDWWFPSWKAVRFFLVVGCLVLAMAALDPHRYPDDLTVTRGFLAYLAVYVALHVASLYPKARWADQCLDWGFAMWVIFIPMLLGVVWQMAISEHPVAAITALAVMLAVPLGIVPTLVRIEKKSRPVAGWLLGLMTAPPAETDRCRAARSD